MKSKIKFSKWFYLSLIGLLIVNLITWNGSLPFESYNGGIYRAAFLQIVHCCLNVAELIVLYTVGKQLSQLSNRTVWVGENWLFVVIIGILSIIGELIKDASFDFADFVTSLFPILRSASPIVTGLLISAVAIEFFKLLTFKSQNQVRWLIEAAFLAQTVFNTNLWGLNNQDNALIYTLIILLGASLSTKSVRQNKFPMAFIIIGITLATIMPIASILAHGDNSTMDRFSLLSNGLIVVGVAETYRLYLDKFKGIPKLTNLIVPITSITTLPIFSERITGMINRHFSSLTFKALGIVIIAVIFLVLGLGLAKGWQLFVNRFWKGRLLKLKIPNSMSEVENLVNGLIVKDWWQLTAWLSCFVVAFISFVTVNVGYASSSDHNIFATIIFNRYGMLFINALFLWMFYRALLALTNRYWFSLLTTVAIELLWSVADRIKINARDDPIMPAEVKMVQAYGDILKMIPFWVILGTVLFILALGIIIFYLEKKHRVAVKQKVWHRIGFVLLMAIAFGSSNWWNHSQSRISKVLVGFGNHPAFYNQLEGVQWSGPLIQYLNNIDTSVMLKPADYNQATMRKLAERYQREARKINKNRLHNLNDQTIIFNLSESFADPRRIPGIKITNNPIKNIDQLKSETTSGLMLSSGYGGGTANMEYMALTGLPMANFMPTLLVPYTQLVPSLSYSWSFNQLFKNSSAIHPYVGSFYSRTTVYKKFKFGKFIYLGSKYKIKHQSKIDNSPYLSDKTAYENTLDQIKKGKRGQFINLISMQNHFPYDKGYFKPLKNYTVSVSNGTSLLALKDYVAGIHYTDIAMQQFINQINKINKTVTLVFYGDHLPGIYDADFKKDAENLRETDYFIYSNMAARKQGAKTLTKDVKFVAPNEFMAMVAEQTNSKVTPYLAFLTIAYHQLPVETMNMAGERSKDYKPNPQFVTRQGKIISQKHFTKKQKQLYHDYQLIQYDLTAGKQYLVKDRKMK